MDHKYEEALERARELHEAGNALTKSQMEIVFPELKESKHERMSKNCIHFLKLQKAHHADTSEIDDCIAYLEHLPEYIDDIRQYAYNKGLVDAKEKQKPAEWSEEDEKMRNNLISLLIRLSANTRTGSTYPNYSYPREIDWLKSLRPQPRWKPSEVQMNALYDILHPADPVNRDAVKSLYKDLQKLL